MITPTKFWTITCSICGKDWNYDDGHDRLFTTATLTTKASAECARGLNRDSWSVIQRQLVCATCCLWRYCDRPGKCSPSECGCTHTPKPTLIADTITLTPHDAHHLSCDSGCGAILHVVIEDDVLWPVYTTPDNVKNPQRHHFIAIVEVAGWEHDPATGTYRCTRCRTTNAPGIWCDHQATDQCPHCTDCLKCEAERPTGTPHQQPGFDQCPRCRTCTTVPQ